MNKRIALEITQKLRSIDHDHDHDQERKETGKSIIKIKKEIYAVRSTSQADAMLAEIIFELL